MPQYYPFLKSERDRLKSLDLKLDAICENPIYAHSIENAALDIIGKAREPADRDFAVVEFTLSKILLSIIDDPAAKKKYAERKSQEFREQLEKESLTYLIKIAREDFGIDLKTEESLRVHFIPFLKYKPDFLRLPQMDLLHGYVQVTKNQLTWVLMGAIKQYILQTIPEDKGFPEGLKKLAGRIRGQVADIRKIERPKIGRLREEALPPCMKDIIASLEAGRANHNAHFVLATFLNGLGLEEDSVLAIFRRSPKFKEKTALYQIRFAKERGYSCPNCESVKSYGLCTSSCSRKHPVSNYIANLRGIKS